jgi:hypothetical protein
MACLLLGLRVLELILWQQGYTGSGTFHHYSASILASRQFHLLADFEPYAAYAV